MSKIIAEGPYTVISTGFIGYGHSDQTEGRGGLIELGRFTDADEAVTAVQGKGVQGSAGEIFIFEWRLYETEAVIEITKLVFGHHKLDKGGYGVGWLNN